MAIGGGGGGGGAMIGGGGGGGPGGAGAQPAMPAINAIATKPDAIAFMGIILWIVAEGSYGYKLNALITSSFRHPTGERHPDQAAREAIFTPSPAATFYRFPAKMPDAM
jgi:hypothetical protein